MEQEAMASRWVDELRHQLESTCHESQDQAAEAIEAWAAKLLMVERATATERGLDTMKVHRAKTEVVLQKS